MRVAHTISSFASQRSDRDKIRSPLVTQNISKTKEMAEF